MYRSTLSHMREEPQTPQPDMLTVERVQTGIRVEKRLLKVMKALAESLDMTLGDLLEGIVLHAFDGQCAFGPATLKKIADLKKIYDFDLDAKASHQMRESRPPRLPKKDSRVR